jgi:hypothetical protein
MFEIKRQQVHWDTDVAVAGISGCRQKKESERLGNLPARCMFSGCKKKDTERLGKLPGHYTYLGQAKILHIFSLATCQLL